MDSGFEDLDLAPIHLRILAFGLDATILIVLALAVGSFALASGVRLGAVAPVLIAISAAYNIGFVTAAGATPGKTAVGLQVTAADGARPRPDSAILRYLTYFVLGIGFPFGTIANLASMLADERRRTFADRIAGTVVTRVGEA